MIGRNARRRSDHSSFVPAIGRVTPVLIRPRTRTQEQTMVDTHVVVNGSERISLPGAIATARADANVTIEVTLKLRRKKALPPLIGRPAAAMTRENLRANYGASQADIDKVVEAFGKFNLKLVESNAATRSVRLSGTIAAMEEAFQVELFNYTHESGNYRGRIGPVRVPVDM